MIKLLTDSRDRFLFGDINSVDMAGRCFLFGVVFYMIAAALVVWNLSDDGTLNEMETIPQWISVLCSWTIGATVLVNLIWALQIGVSLS